MEKIIEVRNLKFSYPDGNLALDNLSLDVYAAQTLGIIGPNGAGKSTLLLHLNGLLNGGDCVKIFGKPMRKENLKFIRQQVGLVFQDPQDQLFMPTISEDVAFGPGNLGLDRVEVEKRVDLALRQVGLLDKKHHLSYHLSIGEQRRAAIATVLSMPCSILVLDEPNSNLDPAGRRQLINLLKELPITKIIATHDLEMVLEICDRVMLLDKGKMIIDGKPLDILSLQALLEPHGLEVPFSILCRR